MQEIHSILPVLAVAVSLVGAIFIRIATNLPNRREAVTLITAGLKFYFILSMLPYILEGNALTFTLVHIFPGIDIAFRVDALGMFFALMASLLWIITSVYSIGYVRAEKEHAQTRYFMSFAIALSATIGVAFSANLLTMFIFYEIITLCTFPLVAHKETPTAMAGARKYLVYLLGTSLMFMMFAIVLTYSVSGTLDFTEGGILAGTTSKAMLVFIFILFMAGTAKAALIPFHSWLPAAMVAPTPVSALLHAVAVVKTGVFVVIKVVLYVFGVSLLKDIGMGTVLVYWASFTIIVASMMALAQDNLKARLAYSTVSQLSYIILGVALLSASGITGSVIHMVMHGFGKITLFFTAGAIYVATHKTNISQLNGIGRRMPLTMTAFTLGAISMIGIPPMGGFVSKFYLALGTVEAGYLPILFVLAGSTLLNAAYFLPIIYRAFFLPLPEGEAKEGIKEAPLAVVIPLSITALGALVLFFKPGVFLELAKLVVAGATGGN